MHRSCVLFFLASCATADVYMQYPPGSNNRLNERSANRNNGDKQYDSQNNNRGGCNVGEQTAATFQGTADNETNTPFGRELNKDQYSLMFYAGAKVPVEWTAQHGCGGREEDDPHKLNCNMVLQYTCNTQPAKKAELQKSGLDVELKDGRNTNTPDAANSLTDVLSDTRKIANDNNGRGRHESEAWYRRCEVSARNKGLFTADQRLRGNEMRFTRQNPNGNRRGLECPEERDYYPYWKPTPWVDIAYLTDHVETDCPDVLANSQNVKEIGVCVYSGTDDAGAQLAWGQLTEGECLNQNNTNITWAKHSHGVAAPDCIEAEWSRVNHLGNGVSGQMNNYPWTVPELDQLGANAHVIDVAANNQIAKCVLRLRYNISTDDYDPRNTTADSNENKKQKIASPVRQNPTLHSANLQGLRLAINTAQFGRTFQDRSHTLYIKTKPTAQCPNTLHHVGVRGKRGNIVQTFPSIEYDFVSNDLEVSVDDCIHFQWSGSNTHNNGNPAGDGQAGDAGEGQGGTDRHNLVGIYEKDKNYPIYANGYHAAANIFENGNFECFLHNNYLPEQGNQTGSAYMNTATLTQTPQKDCAVAFASAGFYNSEAVASSTDSTPMSNLLNGNNPSFSAILKAKKRGIYHYMSTRNNNFSNRSQKGTIEVL